LPANGEDILSLLPSPEGWLERLRMLRIAAIVMDTGDAHLRPIAPDLAELVPMLASQADQLEALAALLRAAERRIIEGSASKHAI
jgi:hypothetical protein